MGLARGCRFGPISASIERHGTLMSNQQVSADLIEWKRKDCRPDEHWNDQQLGVRPQ
jgi:hypothetical protein